MKQYLIIGCGRFGESVAKTLIGLGNNVLVVDSNEKVIQNISNDVTHAVIASGTDEISLKSIGISNFDVGIVAIGTDIEASTLATLILKEAGIKYIVAKANSQIHAKLLYKLGADRVVFPEQEMGKRVANNLIANNLLDYIELSSEYNIMEISILDSWKNKSIKTLDMRAKYGINIMAIKNLEDINIAPGPDYIIKEKDILVVIGHKDQLNKIKAK